MVGVVGRHLIAESLVGDVRLSAITGKTGLHHGRGSAECRGVGAECLIADTRDRLARRIRTSAVALADLRAHHVLVQGIGDKPHARKLALLASLVSRISDRAGLLQVRVQVERTRLHLAGIDAVGAQLAHVVLSRSVVALCGLCGGARGSLIHARRVAVSLRCLKLVAEARQRRAVHARARGVRTGVGRGLTGESSLLPCIRRRVIGDLAGRPIELILAGRHARLADLPCAVLLLTSVRSRGDRPAAEAH